jgi:hypothetical protein
MFTVQTYSQHHTLKVMIPHYLYILAFYQMHKPITGIYINGQRPGNKVLLQWKMESQMDQEASQDIEEMKSEGCGIAEITDSVFAAGGPARWENVRDKLKQLYPGEHIKGDLDDLGKYLCFCTFSCFCLKLTLLLNRCSRGSLAT